MKRQTGFTLIELIVVIVILGILAAVALPRFTNLARDSRIAKLNAAKGAVASASALMHGTVLARNGVADAVACPGGGGTANNSVAATGTVCTENGVVGLVFGYPASATALAAANPGIAAAAGLTSIFNPTLAQLNAEGYAVTVGATSNFDVIGGAGTSGAVGAQINTTCRFTYAAATAAGAAPVIGAITTASSAGC